VNTEKKKKKKKKIPPSQSVRKAGWQAGSRKKRK
jgi:hypothetical protein